MTKIDNLLDGSASTRQAAAAFIEDPLAFFDMSYTRMQSVPRDKLEELQMEALSQRFEQQKDRIKMLAKLAGKQGIKRVESLEELRPLLFEHNVYKSYPSYLLETNSFDKLTTWFDRLTPHDLSGVDVSGCKSIHSWLDLLTEQTPLDVCTSSGTTGTMSFTPFDKSDWRTRILGAFRIQLLQKFGQPPTDADLNEPLHVCWPTNPDGHTALYRSGQYYWKYFGMGKKDYFHPMFDTPGDTDLMYLAAKLRAAQARGDSRVNVPQSLLERRHEMDEVQHDRHDKVKAWMETLVSLAGKRVFFFGPAPLIYDVCKTGLAAGKKCNFAPNSCVQADEGGKGMAMESDWREVIRDFVNFQGKPAYYYAFSEQTLNCVRCEHGRLHLPPWTIPVMLDPETSELLPRSGTHVARGAFFDLAINGVWGGLITGDKVEIDWSDCPCGRTTAHLSDKVSRFSVEQGGSDKISCTATPDAHEEAMDFLTSF